MRKLGFVLGLFWLCVPIVSRAATCGAGYYLDDGECKQCHTTFQAPYYCPGDDIRHECPTISGTTDYGSICSTSRSCCWAWFGETVISNGSMDRYWCYVDPDADTYGVSGAVKCGVYRRDLKCDAGYYSDGTGGDDRYEDALIPAELAARACRPVEAGYYSPDGETERTACPIGLTTIGYGRGADEAGDCGRVLHTGDQTLHLRSEKRTVPALHVKVGDTTFYGDMSTAARGHLRVKIGDTVYSVHDDSM